MGRIDFVRVQNVLGLDQLLRIREAAAKVITDALGVRITALEEAPGGGGGGTTWLTGSGAPSGGTGSVGNFYLDTVDRIAYIKTGASTWTERFREVAAQFDGGGPSSIHPASAPSIDGGGP